MSEPVWILRSVVEAMHDAQLVEHGGAGGLRDPGLLESALARARNRFVYGEADLPALAGAYAFGITRDHPFIDGNKRTAFVAAYVFLRINGLRLDAEEVAATSHVLALASGDSTEAQFADWLRAHASAC